MCLCDLHLGYQIDHKVPLVTAKSEEEIVSLFALDNLSVLCPDCNMRVKRERLVEYDKKMEEDANVNTLNNLLM